MRTRTTDTRFAAPVFRRFHARSLVGLCLAAAALLAGCTDAALTRDAQLGITTEAPGVKRVTFAIPGSKPSTTSEAIVILPSACEQPATATRPADAPHLRFSVVYLLHGYTGNQNNWYTRSNEAGKPLVDLADRYNLIIVLPDGKFSSWYLDAVPDAPDSADWQWETVITRYLVPAIDARFKTWHDPAGRGIAGLSMGGHGAIFLAARHPELFSVCGSMSGVMDLTHSRAKYDIANRIGSFEQYPQRWHGYSAGTQAESFAGRQTALFIDCGVSDGFIDENRTLHTRLIELDIPHDYIERPGGHSWPYWINALPYHMQFMADRLKPMGVEAKE